MTYQDQIQRALRSPILTVQLIAITAWLASLVVNPYISSVNTATYILVASGLGLSTLSMSGASDFRIWRISGFVFVVAMSLAFSMVIHDMGSAGGVWMLPACVTICLAISLLFSYQGDYLLAIAVTWALMLTGVEAPLLFGAELGLLVVLMVAVTGIGVCLNRMFTNAIRSAHKLKNEYMALAETDELTDVPNRRSLMRSLQSALTSEKGEACHFAMIDIDDFKQINDLHGHDTGDLVLKSLGRHLGSIGPYCTVGRLGGEEFGLIFIGPCQQKVLDDLNLVLSTISQPREDGHACSFSGGVTARRKGDGVSDVMCRADRALYAAKRAGKSRVFFDAEVSSGKQ